MMTREEVRTKFAQLRDLYWAAQTDDNLPETRRQNDHQTAVLLFELGEALLSALICGNEEATT